MLNSATRKRNTGSKTATNPDLVGEHAVQALYDNKSPASNTAWSLFRPSGGNAPQPINGILSSMASEIFGCWLIGMSVALAKWNAISDNLMLNGAIVAAAYAGSYYVAAQINPNHVFRRHLNPLFTLIYTATRQIGFIGTLMYIACQALGTFMAAGTVLALLSGSSGAAVDQTWTSIIQLPVPLPVTESTTTAAATTFLMVVLAEIFIGAVLGFVLFFVEFINTSPAKARKNHIRAVRATALATGIAVLVLFQFQIYSFSPVVYGTGLFSGWSRANVDGLDTRAAVNVAQLTDGMYTNSVFGTRGTVWAFYLLSWMASGAVATVFFLATFWLAGDEARPGNAASLFGSSGETGGAASLEGAPEGYAENSKAAIFSGAAIQTQVSQLKHPLLQRQ